MSAHREQVKKRRQVLKRVVDKVKVLGKRKLSYRQGMDILSAHRMVTATQEGIKSIARDFTAVKAVADTFVKWTNEKLEEMEDNTDMEVKAALPEKRAKKRKCGAGEMAEDEIHINAEKVYEVKVHNTILDTAIEAIH
ncbi:hypothetical protein CRENBAI_020790 [Crenichthys baileyi]|uniref:Uncharacterized protein n=1 Tax=Crenichthys baileyi TaxID=28760 RepID=A0AAV9QSM6_9TELE